jgi:hypothetical protein
MDEDVRDALYKIGKLITMTGYKLRFLARQDLTMKDLVDIHETLKYCGEAIFQVAEVVLKKASREKHDI